ncbi:MAG: hypothetical protein R6X34_30230 [Chloroflexota bacterium]
MKKIAGLFKNQQEADKVVDALAKAGVDDISVYTMDNEGGASSPAQPLVMPPLQASYESSPMPASPMPASPISTLLSDLDMDSEAMQFFKRTLQREGGALIVVEPSDSATGDQALHILKERGGQVVVN